MEEIVRAVTRSLRFMDILRFVELVERAPRIEVNCYITTAPEIWEIGLRRNGSNQPEKSTRI
jgi:hypothetical protein